MKYLLAAIVVLFCIESQAQTPGCTVQPPYIVGTTPGCTTNNDGSYMHLDLVSNQQNTAPMGIGWNGTPSSGDVIGFDYSFVYQGTPHYRVYRHTFSGGQTIRDAHQSLINQFHNDPVIISILGDIRTYAMVRPLPNNNSYVQIFQNTDVCSTANFILYTAAANLNGGKGGGQCTLESNPYIGFGRTGMVASGRQPQPGDVLGAMYFAGDATGRILDQRNVDPTYAQLQVTILDPTYGVNTARVDWQTHEFNLSVNSFTINGQPAGPIGMPGPMGPPGGNIAGSIQQSPAATICAGVPTNVNCTYQRVYDLSGLNITGWHTIATVTPSSVNGSWSMNKIKVEIVSNTNGVGFGNFDAQVYLGIASGPPLGLFMGSPSTYGSAAQFRTITVGNVVYLQIASPNGANYISSGLAQITYYLAGAEGNPITWTIN